MNDNSSVQRRHGECFLPVRCSGRRWPLGAPPRAASDTAGAGDRSKEVDAPPAERPRGFTSVAKVWGGCMNVKYSVASAVAVALVLPGLPVRTSPAPLVRASPVRRARTLLVRAIPARPVRAFRAAPVRAIPAAAARAIPAAAARAIPAAAVRAFPAAAVRAFPAPHAVVAGDANPSLFISISFFPTSKSSAARASSPSSL